VYFIACAIGFPTLYQSTTFSNINPYSMPAHIKMASKSTGQKDLV
jgi:hypothetical protein